MIVVEANPIPVYEVVCPECKSKIEYMKSEVCNCHLVCPVCGMSIWAYAINPVRMAEKIDERWKTE